MEWKDYTINKRWKWPELKEIKIKQAIFFSFNKKAPRPNGIFFVVLQKAYPTIEDLLYKIYKILFILGYQPKV